MATVTGEPHRPRMKVHFKLKELEFSFDAEKEDVPMISNSVSRQLAGMIEPVAAAATMTPRRLTFSTSASEADSSGHEQHPVRARKVRSIRSAAQASPESVVFSHNVEHWGFPNQAFTTQEKAIYLLFVSEAQGGPKELPAGTIASLFNKHFKPAGSVRASNVSKYLRAGLALKPALVGEDTTKSPSVWYLTTEGRKTAEQLVIKARGGDKS